MALNLIGQSKNLFGRQIGIEESTILIPTGYRSAESNQEEVSAHVETANGNALTTIYTVPTGKTFYLTSFIYSSPDNSDFNFYANADLIISSSTGNGDVVVKQYHFQIPLKFSSGTLLKGQDSATLPTITNGYTIVGFLSDN